MTNQDNYCETTETKHSVLFAVTCISDSKVDMHENVVQDSKHL